MEYRVELANFKKKNWRDVAVPESVQSCFELSIHFPVFFPANYSGLVAVHGWLAIQTNVWKSINQSINQLINFICVNVL